MKLLEGTVNFKIYSGGGCHSYSRKHIQYPAAKTSTEEYADATDESRRSIELQGPVCCQNLGKGKEIKFRVAVTSGRPMDNVLSWAAATQMGLIQRLEEVNQ